MKRLGALAFIMAATPLLGGCAIGMAMSAAQMIASAAQPTPVSNAQFQPTAREACTAQATQYGAPHIIDVEQRRTNLLIVWGTVTDPQQHVRSFECRFTTKVQSFKLREIGPSR